MLLDDVVFIVATYPYLFNQDIFASTFEPHSYEDLVVVVDEAHSLLDAYTMLERRLTVTDIDRAVEEVKQVGESELEKRLRELKRLITSKAVRRIVRLDPSTALKILGDPEEWDAVAQEIRLRKLTEALTSGQLVKTYVTRVALLADVLTKGARLYLVLEQGRLTIRAMPVDPCAVTEQPLNRAKAAILMSGTMPPANLLRDLLCIHKKITSVDVELFYPQVAASYANTRRVVVAAEVTSKFTERSTRMFEAYAKYLEASATAIRKGIILAVFPSYDFIQKVVSTLNKDVAGELIVEDPTTTITRVQEAIRSSERAVIVAVAGGKLVEGVEYTDPEGRSLVKIVFIGGVPYPQPDPIFEDYLKTLANKLGESKARDYAFNVTASIRVRQAIGRAQRRPGDRVLVVLADRRFLYRRLRELLRLRYDRVTFNMDSFKRALTRMALDLGLDM